MSQPTSIPVDGTGTSVDQYRYFTGAVRTKHQSPCTYNVHVIVGGTYIPQPGTPGGRKQKQQSSYLRVVPHYVVVPSYTAKQQHQLVNDLPVPVLLGGLSPQGAWVAEMTEFRQS